MEYILLIFWFLFLIKWADLLVDWAWSIAKKLWISSLVIWLTIIAFWTSAPEFVVSFVALLNQKSNLAISNVVWSNIANITLVLWFTAFLYPIKIPNSTVKKEIPFAILISFLLIFLIKDNILSRFDGLLFLILFIWFLYYTYKISKNKNNLEDELDIKDISKIKSIIFIIFWFAWLIFWWKLIVNNAIKIASSFGISEAFVWVTIVAIWTSLPELASSMMAAFKKNTNMAIWSIVWSNIFNILWILWFSATFKNLEWYNWIFIDLFVCLFLIVLILIFTFIPKKYFLSKKEWIILSLIYFSYLWYLIINL